MDELEAKAIEELQVQVESETSNADLNLTLASYIPQRILGSEGCLPGFAGYQIVLRGREIKSSTFFDLGFQPVRRGLISNEHEYQLQAILQRWDSSDSAAQVSWNPSPKYCCFDISSSGTISFSYRWHNDAAAIPETVVELVSALQNIIAAMPPDESVAHPPA